MKHICSLSLLYPSTSIHFLSLSNILLIMMKTDRNYINMMSHVLETQYHISFYRLCPWTKNQSLIIISKLTWREYQVSQEFLCSPRTKGAIEIQGYFSYTEMAACHTINLESLEKLTFKLKIQKYFFTSYLAKVRQTASVCQITNYLPPLVQVTLWIYAFNNLLKIIVHLTGIILVE